MARQRVPPIGSDQYSNETGFSCLAVSVDKRRQTPRTSFSSSLAVRIVLPLAAAAGFAWFGGWLVLSKPVSAQSTATGPSFVEFESGQVRPLAESADGTTLFAVNTPNGTLEVFDLTSGYPSYQYRVPVGLEPVAVAVRSSTEV
jgi:hypothetical protein